MLKPLHRQDEDGGSPDLDLHRIRSIPLGAGSHMGCDPALSDPAVFPDDPQNLLHLIIVHPDQEGGVSLPQKTSGAGQFRHPEIFPDQGPRQAVAVPILYTRKYQLHAYTSRESEISHSKFLMSIVTHVSVGLRA